MKDTKQTQIPDAQVPEAQPTNKKKKGVFPRLSLKKALELPRAIYAVGQGEPVRRLKVFDHLGKAPGSGPSRVLIIVSGMYGLTDGGFQADYLKLTDLGKRVATNENLGLIYEILFKNDIFSKFIEYWKEKALPEEDIASDWLIRTFSLTPDDAKSFWAVIKENIQDYQLTEQLSGKRVVISKEVALQSHGTVTTPAEIIPLTQLDISPKISGNLPMSEKITSTAVETADVKLENGGVARIIVSSQGEITKTDVKKMKTQIDIFSNFIDEV